MSILADYTKIVAMVASVVRDDPRAEQVIVGDEPATVRLAMADRSNG